MKCPNEICGKAFFRPQLRQAGVGTVLQCPVCRRYFDTKGNRINDEDLNKHNPEEPYDEDEDEAIWGGFAGGHYAISVLDKETIRWAKV